MPRLKQDPVMLFYNLTVLWLSFYTFTDAIHTFSFLLQLLFLWFSKCDGTDSSLTAFTRALCVWKRSHDRVTCSHFSCRYNKPKTEKLKSTSRDISRKCRCVCHPISKRIQNIDNLLDGWISQNRMGDFDKVLRNVNVCNIQKILTIEFRFEKENWIMLTVWLFRIGLSDKVLANRE